jgi:hypothetical protein
MRVNVEGAVGVTVVGADNVGTNNSTNDEEEIQQEFIENQEDFGRKSCEKKPTKKLSSILKYGLGGPATSIW